MAPRGDGPASNGGAANADAAKLRKAFAAQLAKEQKKPAADVVRPAPAAAAPAPADVKPPAPGTTFADADVPAAVVDVSAREGDAGAGGNDATVMEDRVKTDVGTVGGNAQDSLWPDESTLRGGANGTLDQLEDNGPRGAGVDSGGLWAQEDRPGSPEEDPLTWFKETYVSPRGVSQSAAPLGTFIPLDDLFPGLQNAGEQAGAQLGLDNQTARDQ